jgi:hypothetical protein
MKEYLLEKYCPEYFDVLSTIEMLSEEELNMVNPDTLPDNVEDLDNHIKNEILWDTFDRLFRYFYGDILLLDEFEDEIYEDYQNHGIIECYRTNTYRLYIDNLISFLEDVTKVPVKNHPSKADLSLYLNDEGSNFKWIIK